MRWRNFSKLEFKILLAKEETQENPAYRAKTRPQLVRLCRPYTATYTYLQSSQGCIVIWNTWIVFTCILFHMFRFLFYLFFCGGGGGRESFWAIVRGLLWRSASGYRVNETMKMFCVMCWWQLLSYSVLRKDKSRLVENLFLHIKHSQSESNIMKKVCVPHNVVSNSF